MPNSFKNGTIISIQILDTISRMIKFGLMVNILKLSRTANSGLYSLDFFEYYT